MRCPNCHSDVGDRTQCHVCGATVQLPAQEYTNEQPGRHNERAGREGEQAGRQRSRTRQADTQQRPATVPTGVKITAVLLGLFGVALLFSGLVLRNAGQTAIRYGARDTLGAAAFVLVGLGLGDLAAAYGVWTMKFWGRTIALVTLTIGALSTAFVIASGATMNGLVGLLLHGGLLAYLLTRRSKFRQPRRPQTTGETASRQGSAENEPIDANAGHTRDQQSVRQPR